MPVQKMWRHAAWALLLGLGAVSARAQGLPDPTRPPSGFVDPADAAAGGERGETPAGLPAASEPGLVLQSVVLPQRGKPVAVISGQYVPLGASVSGWELRHVGEGGAVLERAGELKSLSLTPLVRKSMVTAAETVDVPVKPAPPRGKKAKKPRKAS